MTTNGERRNRRVRGSKMLELKVPIILEGTWNNVKKLSEQLAKNIESTTGVSQKGTGDSLATAMAKGFNQIAMKIGILAAIWGAFDLFLRPIMSMFKMIMVLLFMPLMPLIKGMLANLKTVAEKVRAAQESAGGEGIGAFTSGLMAMLGEGSMWAVIGGLIVAGMAMSASLATLGGIIAAGIALAITWDNITKMSQGDLEGSLKGWGWAGLSAGIATLLLTGNAPAAITVGTLTFMTGMGVSLFANAIKETDIKKAFLQLGMGSMMAGIVAGGVLTLLGLGGTVATTAALSVGTLTFLAGIAIKLNAETEGMTFKQQFEKAKETQGVIERTWETMKTWVAGAKQLIDGILAPLETVGKMIGSPTKGSYPIVYSLIEAGKAWKTMGSTSITVIGQIINKLASIPREIVTIHRIKTVYE